MKDHRNHPARPNKVAVNTEQSNQREDAESEAEAKSYDQQYLYHLECLVISAMNKSEFEIGRTLIREGAVALDDNLDYFDRSERLTSSGLAAIVAGGFGRAWQELQKAMHNWRDITLTEINAIREYRRVPPIGADSRVQK